MKKKDQELLSLAEEAFAEYVVQSGGKDAAAFEALCSQRPELEAQLRSLRNDNSFVEGLLGNSETLDLIQDRGSDHTLVARPSGASGGPERERFDPDQLLARLLQEEGEEPRYQPMEPLGSGGMGEVVAVWDSVLRRNLAMKRIRRDRCPGDVSELRATPQVLERFMEEAQVTSQLDHPGVVPIHELGIDEQSRVFFTMRKVKGEDLDAVYERVWAGQEDWSVTRVLGILQRVCETMAYAHHKGVLHRDLKPGNVMVGAFGETYVMDWGLARIQGTAVTPADAETQRDPAKKPHSMVDTDRLATRRKGTGSSHSVDGEVRGTPSYMPPEQARGDISALTGAADIYAIGAMLYQLLSRRAPFVMPGNPMSGSDLVDRVLAGPPEPLQRLAPDAPPELLSIVERAMARHPKDRYADMTALGNDLRAFLENRVVQAHRTGPVAEFHKWTVRNRGAAMSMGGGLFVAMGGLGVTAADRTVRAAEAVEQTAIAVQETEAVQQDLDEETRLRKELEKAVGTIADQKTKIADLKAQEEEQAEALAAKAQEVLAKNERLAEQTAKLEEQETALQAALTQQQEALGKQEAALKEVELAEAQVAQAAQEAKAAAAQAQKAQGDTQLAEQRALQAGQAAAAAEAKAEAARGALAEVEKKLLTAERSLAPVRDFRRLTLLEMEAEDAWPIGGDLALRFAGWLQEGDRLVAGLDAHREQLAGLAEDAPGRDVLEELVGRIETFGSAEGPLEEVRERVAKADGLLRRSVLAQSEAWGQALAAIADSPAYGGLEFEALTGLVPLGENAQGLWEFAHLLTGEPSPQGPAPGGALTLVLLPGGRFDMGSRPAQGGLRHGDPGVVLEVPMSEQPRHVLTLEPFLISKYEVTFDQWARWPGRPESAKLSEGAAPLDPATRLSWYDAQLACFRLGLELPTEAQWEYAARSGVGAPWWCVPDGVHEGLLSYLDGTINLADRSLKFGGVPYDGLYEAKLDDDHAGIAAAGSFGPNRFGLHTVLGNAAEWCRDGWAPYTVSARPGDGLRAEPAMADLRIVRGGHYLSTAQGARSGARMTLSPGDARPTVGLRPVLRLPRRE